MPEETTLEEFDKLVICCMSAPDKHGMRFFRVNQCLSEGHLEQVRGTLRTWPIQRWGDRLDARALGHYNHQHGEYPEVRFAVMVLGELITLRDHPES